MTSTDRAHYLACAQLARQSGFLAFSAAILELVEREDRQSQPPFDDHETHVNAAGDIW